MASKVLPTAAAFTRRWQSAFSSVRSSPRPSAEGQFHSQIFSRRLLVLLAALLLLPACGMRFLRLHASRTLRAHADEVPVSGDRFGEFVADLVIPEWRFVFFQSSSDRNELDFQVRFEEDGKPPLLASCHTSYVRRLVERRGLQLERVAPETRCTYSDDEGAVAGTLTLGMTGDGRMAGSAVLGDVHLRLRGTERSIYADGPRHWRNTTLESGEWKGVEVLWENRSVGLVEFLTPEGVWLPREGKLRRAVAATAAVVRGGRVHLYDVFNPYGDPYAAPPPEGAAPPPEGM